ncbi:SAM-dependent methyltransferase [Paenibacillus yanchengensis]|uniref:SAM-dependent methyltransferase n=1 Tax=Paenibacillus yanchengensis TaxID=2035833 RepID=A0ABW4YPV8_9BACL
MNQWIVTANQHYIHYAMEELRRLIPDASFTPLEIGTVCHLTTDLTIEQLNDLIVQQPPIFVRHLQPVTNQFTLMGNVEDIEQIAETVRYSALLQPNCTTAVHVRIDKDSIYTYSIVDTKAIIDAILVERNIPLTMSSPQTIVSVYVSKQQVYIGVATPTEMLSDWPGGAIRFQREENQISRAKFKLLEAERIFSLDFSSYHTALDIGAAPGGWTSLLLERGLTVTAVDPAELHESIRQHPALTYLKKNANDVKFPSNHYDLLVCDMSWSPLLMSRLILQLEGALQPSAIVIVTIKLMHKKPLQTIKEVINRLQAEFHLERAKQLFHNRDEITLFLRKK